MKQQHCSEHKLTKFIENLLSGLGQMLGFLWGFLLHKVMHACWCTRNNIYWNHLLCSHSWISPIVNEKADIVVFAHPRIQWLLCRTTVPWLNNLYISLTEIRNKYDGKNGRKKQGASLPGTPRKRANNRKCHTQLKRRRAAQLAIGRYYF